ncbi:MAG: universal stress protein [Nitrosomonadales bacterium]|nr:universal stress protein [Nitrosomonadales bacterium]
MGNYPFNRILLATEHTEFDAGAERLAFAMAKRCGVPLRVIVPLLSNPEYEAEMPELALRAEQDAGSKIAALRKQADALGVQLDVQVRRGAERHAEIVAEAAEFKADLVVIRRRGKPGFLSRMLIGEMVSKVIHDISCSVLLVPRAAEFWDRRVLAAVGDTPSASDIAKTAGTIAGLCGLPLTVLSVSPDEASLSRTQSLNTLNVALASASSDRVHGEVRVGKPVEQTIAAVRETGADLVVIGRQRYHLIPFGSRSIMQDIAGNMDVPTLVVPA